MKYKEKQSLGCVLEAPDERDYDYNLLAGGPMELPESFSLDVPHFYQNGIDACVGMAVAAAKSVQEQVKISPRYAWHLAKKMQEYQGWGTYIKYCLKGQKEEGALEFGTVNEEVVGVDRTVYMKPHVTDDMKKIAELYKIKSYWRAGYGAGDIQSLKNALLQEKVPLITSMQWYKEYDSPKKGFLPKGVTPAYGHAFILKGWDVDKNGREYWIFQNSWRPTWGNNGDFYIYIDEMDQYDLRSFYVITDIESDKASILAKYDGQLVRNADHPAYYYVSQGKIAWIKNEESFYFGRGAGFWGDWDAVNVVDPDLQTMYDLTF